jgi:hypothetical protein
MTAGGARRLPLTARWSNSSTGAARPPSGHRRDERLRLPSGPIFSPGFGKLRFRAIGSLKIDRFNVDVHARRTPRETKRYYDNVVAA